MAVAKEQLEAAEFNRSYSSIHANASGYILRKFINAGQVVDVGDPILLTNGAANGAWILKVGISDKQWSTIKLRDRATVTVDAFPNRTFVGYVSRKWETADPQTGAFTVELEVESGNAKFASGMFGAAELASSAEHASWSVPHDAVLDANDNEGFVFVTNDNKRAIKLPVVIESFDGNSVRISDGLENSNALIISGSAYLADNSPIIISK